MAALLFRRLAGAHRGRVPLAAAAACGGAALFYASTPCLVAHMEEKGEEAAGKVALNPDKWLEFKLQEKAIVSHNSQLFRFSFDPSTKLGLDVASCLITRAPIGEEVEGRRKYVIRPYTPISDPDSKGYFDLLIKVYPDGKMSQYFASLKPGDVVEVKGPIEKLRYNPNMKRQIGMTRSRTRSGWKGVVAGRSGGRFALDQVGSEQLPFPLYLRSPSPRERAPQQARLGLAAARSREAIDGGQDGAQACLRNPPAGGLQRENMRDPFDAPVDFINADHKAGNDLTRTNMPLSARDYGLQNGDAKPFAPNPNTLVRHQLQGASQHTDLTVEDPSTRFMDPETKELYLRSRSQEDEILLLRKQIADASLKELRLLSEKHILERKLTDMRLAVDEKQEEAISGAIKQLSQRKNHLEENVKLANELKVEEEELYFFTSSLLGMLAEYDMRPPQINASTITIGTKRLYQQMHWKIRSLNDNLGDMPQPGSIYNTNHQRVTPLRNEPSPSYNVDPNRNTLHQYDQDPSGRNAEQMYRGPHFQQDIVGATPTNYFEENAGAGDSQLYRSDNQDYSPDGDPVPGIEGFQIVGEPRPGFALRACGFPTNGTTLCNFQWVRYLEDGTRQSIEGATIYDYVVTADDVGTLLAVDCTPMDDNGRQGDLVREFANNENKIACDPEMQNAIDLYISNGKADFDVFVLQAYSPEEWEVATLVLRRPGYQIKLKHTSEVVIDEKYSPNLQTKIPNGRTTQFVLVSSAGVNVPFNTQGITDNEDYNVRLRDLIVLVMRTFQSKALDAKRKGKV